MTTPTPAVCPFPNCPLAPSTPAMPTPPRTVPKERAGLPACRVCARGSTRQGVPRHSCCWAWATGGAIPKRGASWTCLTRSAVCAHAKTRAGASCPRKPPPVGGVGAWRATECGSRKTRGKWSGCGGRGGSVGRWRWGFVGGRGGLGWARSRAGGWTVGSVAWVGVGGVDGEWVLWVGLGGWGALGGSSGACGLEFSGWVVACAVGVVG
jgi:hypothetical protein